MAWRPTKYLLDGELDNTILGKVTGWIRFTGLKEKVLFDLKGNFHRDIRGAKIKFFSNGYESNEKAEEYMQGFSLNQTGKAGVTLRQVYPREITWIILTLSGTVTKTVG